MTQIPLPARRHRFREDGWTPDVQRAFIEALAASGSVAQACGIVQRSTSTAYRLRARPDAQAFRAAWSAATSMAYRQVFEIAMDRIVGGQETPVFHKGDQVGVKTTHSDRLLCYMLGHLRPERPIPTAREVARGIDDRQDYDLAWWLAELDGTTEGLSGAAVADMEETETALYDWRAVIDGSPPPLEPELTEAVFVAMTDAQQAAFYSGNDPFAVPADDDEHAAPA